jgi:predicted acetyltransferase
MSLTLLEVNETELNQIARLAQVTWNDHYPAIVGQQQVDYMLDKIYSHESMLDQLKKGQKFYFIVLDGEKVGFLSLSQVISNGKAETFIHKFYILTQKQKSGLGSKVMKLIYNEYPNSNSYKLTVNRQNYKSINFYFKNGFVIDSVADFDIGNGYFMNDFIMTKHIV